MLALFSLVICYTANAEEAVQPKSDKLQEDISYFFGFAFGNNLLQGGNTDIDFDQIKRGLDDALGGRDPALTEEEQKAVIAEIQARQQKVQDMAQREGLDTARKYLADSGKEEGVITTESGLQYQILTKGTGKKPTASNTVKVHYEGTLITGQVFDSSIQRGEPVEFRLNQVIPGWTEGLQHMQEGARHKLIIPPELGYGAGGTRGIPPNSVLIFEVELLEVK